MISIVVPLCNEVESLAQLHEELQASAERLTIPCEFIFVDDGSTDGTWPALQAMQQQDARVRAVRLKRNFGQTPAMACGIARAQGDVIVTMDGDLQNDPADIPRLLEKLDEDYDMVCGWRHQRQDKLWTRRVPSIVANRLIGWLTGVRLHDYGCSLKAYRADSVKRVPLYAELHRFIPAMATLTGTLVTEVKVNHRSRRHGRTKYNLGRTWRVALDMLTVSLLIRFATTPLRLFGLLSLTALAIGIACGIRSWSWYVGPYTDIPQILPGVALLGVWLAVHLAVVGWLAELCLQTSHHRPEDLVAIRGVSTS